MINNIIEKMMSLSWFLAILALAGNLIYSWYLVIYGDRAPRPESGIVMIEKIHGAIRYVTPFDHAILSAVHVVGAAGIAVFFGGALVLRKRL